MYNNNKTYDERSIPGHTHTHTLTHSYTHWSHPSPEPPAKLLVVHLGFVLADSPAPGHLVRVGEFELPAVASPGDEVLARLVRQLLQEELPQLDGTAPW